MEEYKRPLIQIFLRDFRSAAKDNFEISRRVRNTDTLKELGLTFQDCRNIILSLAVEDCCREPEADKDKARGGSVWFFGKKIEGREIYIKLKVVTLPNGKRLAKCLSFHFADHQLQYPLK